MSRVAAFIPIKQNSERVKGKNFRVLGDKKLYEHIIENAISANCFDKIYIDTDSKEIKEYVKEIEEVEIIDRKPELATNTANGNDLLVYHGKIKPEYDYYFQLFATAPFLRAETIKKCVDILSNSNTHDSIFTGIERRGFFWLNNNPVNYRPGVLPRSQDLVPLIEETTALYGIKKESLTRYNCRIGEYPYIYKVDFIEAIDINTVDDLITAEVFLEKTKKSIDFQY